MILLRTVVLIAAWAILAALLQWLIGNPAGWIAMCLALGAMLLGRAARTERVARWARDPESAPPAAVGPWDDILAPLYRYLRAQARQLSESRDAMQGMLAAAQALPDGAVTLNQDLQIDWCNRVARQHLGLRLPADRGTNLLNLVRAPEFIAYSRQDDWPEPILVRMAVGSQERLLMMQLTAYAQNQRLLITRDVTQIEKLETTRRDFVANVSHELRTPLTVLTGFLETLREMPDEALSTEQRAQYLTMMHEQAQRMQAIVADLLTLSTLESSPNAEPHRVRMAALLQTARQQTEALSAGRHTLVWHLDPQLDVLGAESELSSAISNLLTNAVRYTPDGGVITVRWETLPEGGARYSVQDTGIGIAPRHIPRLTERFYRVDRGRSRAVGGTGLGLAITKHIAMRHDAELSIASEVGKGSTFSLIFPADRVVDGELA
ncbi:phosphate regulon sensor histidine kinase PhoR [Bordetella genomosp. 9]|uniref:histidine kinase n=1 Tax=Bordetella genomosp. 9 TaxID=1416803 RepID=A0A1W6Z3W8_9BORD|nr:phosphate regulon sensor histidine kinase PhoR [Bordetella genomosp. 9]ARP88070.1 phosphate regulon sensor histidine kinase PhoR [Bordetella genomosp. 9]ARP92034.1 phosphate regulon sensor histidine kinase PhoR [Bordetella genomosp. 9]